MKGLLFKGVKRRVFAFMAAIALSFSLIGVVPARRVKAEGYDTFTLYYYYEGTETLYVDFWDWTGLEFGSGVETGDYLNWNKYLGKFSKVEGKDNWYSIDFKIKDATTTSDGLDIYAASTKITGYAASDEGYKTLVSAKSDEYYIKDGIYTSEPEEAEEEFEEIEGYSWQKTNLIINGDFEAGSEGWSGDSGEVNEADDGNDSKVLSIWMSDTEDKAFSRYQNVTLEAGWYYISLEQEGPETESGLSVKVGNIIENKLPKATGWSKWTECKTKYFYVEEAGDYKIDITGTVAAAGWGHLDNVVLYKYAEDTTVYPAEITVKKVENLGDDFANGVDISAIHSIYASGAYCRNFKGEKLSEAEFFQFLAENGVNWVRIRVWNDPYDENGNGYGGGNNDLSAAKIMGKYASDAEMNVLIDFHFSDFWADPGKQQAPKEWSNYTVDQKATAISEYVTSSLNELITYGVNVGMVQIGNETNGSFCGEKDWSSLNKMFDAGCDAVHSVAKTTDRDILAVLHFTNPETAGRQSGYAAELANYDGGNGVSYDVFASSYYPYWHGSLSNLKTVLSGIANTYHKKVMVAETSYAWTLEDGDGHDNTVRDGDNDSDPNCIYPFTVSGQAAWVRDVVDTVNSIEGGIGVFYWEAAWIPVQYYDRTADDAEEILKGNRELWEEYGSGWAASYSGEYDEDASMWYGGSAIDNQAFFDFDGTALDSIRVYRYMRTGSLADKAVDSVKKEKVSVELNNVSDIASLGVPETVTVFFNDMTSTEISVDWDEDELEEAIADAKENGYGIYKINGIVEVDEVEYTAILELSILPYNLLVNPSFEDSDVSMWNLDGISRKDKKKDNNDNMRTGDYNLHFNAVGEYSFYQTVTLDKGYYIAGGYSSGGVGNDSDVRFYVEYGENKEEIDAEFNGWKNWFDPEFMNIIIAEDGTEFTIGVTAYVTGDGPWGAYDDFYLYKMGEVYTVTFDTLGNSASIDPVVVIDGNCVDKPDDPTPLEGKEVKFTGWYTDKDCKNEFDFDTEIIKDITLYAGWKSTAKQTFALESSSQNVTWIFGDGDIRLIAHGEPNDAETFEHYKGASIAKAADVAAAEKAGENRLTPFASLGRSQSRAESGSLRLTIFASYLETLEPGDYILRIEFDTDAIETTITIKAKEESESDSKVVNTDDKVDGVKDTEKVAPDADVKTDDKAADASVKTDDKAATNSDSAPKTGDNTPVSAVMLILLISAAGLSYMLGLKREKRRYDRLRSIAQKNAFYAAK